METGIIMIAIIIFINFIPLIVAINRKTTNTGLVFALCFFLWWTVLFWIVALFLASSGETKEQVEIRKLQLEKLRAWNK